MHTLTLKTGLPFGKDEQRTFERDVELQQLTTAQLLDAEEASEKVVFDLQGQPTLTSSPFRFGLEVTRRRIKRVGQINGPLSRELLGQLTPDDYEAINKGIRDMDKAQANVLIAGEMAERGRVQAVSE
ncbi:phage tail assembly protein [Aeromonas piscicola]|uniref:phage tail assembly protein n=1 Tax=Aeromonas piscicola TaxID=600645 RepID=UPI0005B3308B|nr:phage tail assembly protein [Aeromonas piscicola]